MTKSILMKKFLWIAPFVFFCACDGSRVYEDNQDLADRYWHKNDPVTFTFEITEPDQHYNLYTNIRNSSAYPYHNLYYQYSLTDTLGNQLLTKLQNIDLFDPKSGEPFGAGLGDLFDHQQLIVEDYVFPASGSYSVSFQQYMRTDSLPMILSIGLRVEKSINHQ